MKDCLLKHSPLNFIFNIINKKALRVLAYHGIEDQKGFEQQILYCMRKYRIIGIQDLIDFYEKGSPFPKGSLLITFDDGKLSVLEKGYPVLKKYGIPAVVFICPEVIEKQQPFWWEKIKPVLSENEIEELKNIPWNESEKIISKIGPVSFQTVEGNMNWDQLSELHDNGVVIANHTLSHPILPQCTEEREFSEIETCRKRLNDKGFQGDILAYPNGYCSRRTVENAKRSGIRCSFLFDHKLAYPENHALMVSRLRVRSSYSLNRFGIIMSGMYPWLLRKSGRIRSEVYFETNLSSYADVQSKS